MKAIKRHKYFILLCIIIFSSCKSQSDFIEISPEMVNNAKSLTLSTFADDISYIPLSNDIIFGGISKIEMGNSSIYISTMDYIMEFDENGKYMKTYAKRGRGPGEFVYHNAIGFDKTTGTIYVSDYSSGIKVYSKSGSFIRNIRFEDIGIPPNINELFFNDSKLFAFYYIDLGKAEYNWVVLDTLGSILSYKKNDIPEFYTTWGARGTTYIYKGDIYYWNCYEDTVYVVRPDMSYSPTNIYFPKGEHRIPLHEYEMQDGRYYFSPRLLESENYLFVNINDPILAAINKKDNSVFVSNSVNKRMVINDLDGGCLFEVSKKNTPIFEKEGREYLISYVSAYEIKAHANSDEFRNSIPKYPEKKEQFKELADKLEDNDNAVIILLRLKLEP